jgi:hypothetical protein
VRATVYLNPANDRELSRRADRAGKDRSAYLNEMLDAYFTASGWNP